jgi:hypothetical protein
MKLFVIIFRKNRKKWMNLEGGVMIIYTDRIDDKSTEEVRKTLETITNNLAETQKIGKVTKRKE